MSVYRWSASSGLFFGSISSALLLEEILLHGLTPPLPFMVFLAASLTGVAASLVALFLQRDDEDPPDLLDHRAVAFIGIGLSSWPWILMEWLLWCLEIGPP